MQKKVISDENWNIDYFNFLSVCCCPSVFLLYKSKKDMSYKECFYQYLKMNDGKINKKDAEQLMWLSLYAHDLAVFRQSVCLLETVMKNSLVDLSSDRFKTYMMNLRENVIVEGGDGLTNYNFIKLIRNTFAHNNELEQKPQLTFFEDEREGYIKFKIEDPLQGIKIVIGPEDMDNLCYAIIENTSSEHIPGSTLAIRTRRLKNSLLGNYFDPQKINRYIQELKGEELCDLKLDENQERAILNYFKDGYDCGGEYCVKVLGENAPITIDLLNTALVNTIFPRTNNAVSMALKNHISINAIYGQIRKNPNMTYNDILTTFGIMSNSEDEEEKNFGTTASYLLVSPQSVFLEISTALTTILSNRDTEDLEEEYQSDFEDGTLRHIRNALMHGTYFYDFDKSLQIYDGQRKLKFITSLDGVKVLSKTQELALKRWKDTMKFKTENSDEKY